MSRVPRPSPRSARVATVVLLLAPAAACRIVAVDPPPGDGYRSRFEGLPVRTWVGPEFWANRLQDWRVANDRVECVEASESAALRTLHLLTHRTRLAGDGGEGSFRARVRLGAIEPDLPLGPGALAGFLVGAGGEHVDHRLAAQVHGAPAEEGGLLALVDGAGRVTLRDLSRPARSDGASSVPMGTSLEDVPEPSGVRTAGAGFAARGAEPVDLELVAGRYDDRTFATVVARAASDGAVLSTATLEGLPASLLDGAVALVSHRGPDGGRAGYWFERFTLAGDLVEEDRGRTFGPVLCVQYSIDETQPRGGPLLSLTAQMPPLGARDSRSAVLEVDQGDGFEPVARAELYEDSETFTFRVAGFDARRAGRYRVVYDLVVGENRTRRTFYEGALRAAPADGEVVVAHLGGVKHYSGGLAWNESGLWFPHADVVAAVLAHDPDLVYFSGDQLDADDLTPPVREPLEAALGDYLTRWYRWCWSFRELCRDRPCITVPDERDVYQDHLWGNGGARGPAVVEGPDGGQETLSAEDRGGYTMSPRFVNAVHRTQLSHLPPAHTPEPIGPGISVFHTDVTWGGVSCAVLSDRMFKSPPAVLVPEGRVRDGRLGNPELDPLEADVPGAELLGARQLAFLDEWAADWSGGAWVKLAVSQTPFADLAALPAGAAGGDLPRRAVLPTHAPDERLAADCASGGWPRSGRDAALVRLRRAAALHLAGDPHLASTIRYGIEAHDDAGYCLTPPAVAGPSPDRGLPPEAGHGLQGHGLQGHGLQEHRRAVERRSGDGGRLDARPDDSLSDEERASASAGGRFVDGFGNRMTVLAFASPRRGGVESAALHDRGPGYALARLSRDRREATLEAWPRHVDPRAPGAAPYAGWPVTVSLDAGDGRAPVAWLPEVAHGGGAGFVVQVEREVGDGGVPGEVLYTRRVPGPTFVPPVFERQGRYTVRADPVGPVAGGGWAREWRGLEARPAAPGRGRP